MQRLPLGFVKAVKNAAFVVRWFSTPLGHFEHLSPNLFQYFSRWCIFAFFGDLWVSFVVEMSFWCNFLLILVARAWSILITSTLVIVSCPPFDNFLFLLQKWEVYLNLLIEEIGYRLRNSNDVKQLFFFVFFVMIRWFIISSHSVRLMFFIFFQTQWIYLRSTKVESFPNFLFFGWTLSAACNGDIIPKVC